MSARQTKILLSALTTMACLSPAPLNAMPGGGGCVSGNISMSVVSSPLDFADVSPSGCPGTVSVDQKNGAVTTTGCIAGTSGIASRARIRVVGGQASAGDKVFIRVPASATISSGGDNMSVTSFLLNAGPGRATITMNGNKTTTVEIGATLNVGGGQAGGTYTGAGSVSATCT